MLKGNSYFLVKDLDRCFLNKEMLVGTILVSSKKLDQGHQTDETMVHRKAKCPCKSKIEINKVLCRIFQEYDVCLQGLHPGPYSTSS